MFSSSGSEYSFFEAIVSVDVTVCYQCWNQNKYVTVLTKIIYVWETVANPSITVRATVINSVAKISNSIWTNIRGSSVWLKLNRNIIRSSAAFTNWLLLSNKQFNYYVNHIQYKQSSCKQQYQAIYFLWSKPYNLKLSSNDINSQLISISQIIPHLKEWLTSVSSILHKIYFLSYENYYQTPVHNGSR